MNYYLITFLPKSTKSTYFSGGEGYKAGTRWVFQEFIPPSIQDCPSMQIDKIDEESAFGFINQGLIYNDYLPEELSTSAIKTLNSPRAHSIEIEDAPNYQPPPETQDVFLQKITQAVALGVAEASQKSDAPDLQKEATFDDELSLADVQNKIFNSSEGNLVANQAKFGNRQEQDVDMVLDNNAKLLRATKQKSTIEPVKSQKTSEDQVDKVEPVSTEDTELQVVELLQEELPENILEINQSKNRRKQRISDMLENLKQNQ